MFLFKTIACGDSFNLRRHCTPLTIFINKNCTNNLHKEEILLYFQALFSLKKQPKQCYTMLIKCNTNIKIFSGNQNYFAIFYDKMF